MRRVIPALWMFISVSVCFAQTERPNSNKQNRPDLSGAWILDKSKSPKVDVDRFTLVIVHREPEIRITEKLLKDGRESIKESVHYTDGRSDSYVTKGKDYSQVKIRWQGKALVIENAHTTSGTRFEIVTTEEWKLSNDNKSLTRTVANRQRVSLNETIIPRIVSKYIFTRSS
jgi:hypothetical protein